ncbi:threonine aldolase family protein [Indiicoccus explosivorum]|uniref:threonine aldolase family protein n=1 Tax=Indiicoccus explosivorum TaxID=1917864 RepID=UPI000B44F347|nr:aminotransferase class I/II-fold pyridoxal phosphate-dependent enzyme [Indiicoccus explosivorum]
MSGVQRLKETFNQTEKQLAGHGKRNVSILKEAFEGVSAGMMSDQYGTGAVIEDFQQKMAAFLGKEAAEFFPSGTMAQQAALRIWSDEKGVPRVAYHPLSHLEIHESDALKELHRIDSVLLTDPDKVITLEDIRRLEAPVSCILLELPQREIGGQLPPYEELEAISAYCREHGIRLHMDGARLLEVLPVYGKSASEVSALFDSVYLSVYKGIGGIAGAVLAGDAGFIDQAKVWKHRHGGNLISLYPYIMAADHHFEKRKDRFGDYYTEAKALAARFSGLPLVTTLPDVPVSNMFHVHISLPKEQAARALAEVQEQTGIGIAASLKDAGADRSYFEMALGDAYAELTEAELDDLFSRLGRALEAVRA